MDWLIFLGAFVSLAGLLGLVLSAMRILAARRAKLDDEAMRARLQKVMPLNMGALFLSVIGLMMIVIGMFLG